MGISSLHPQSGSSVQSEYKWNLEMLVFADQGNYMHKCMPREKLEERERTKRNSHTCVTLYNNNNNFIYSE